MRKNWIFCVLSTVFICLLSIEAQAVEIVLSSWGGAYEKAVMKAMVEPFEKETGIKVIVTSYPDFAKMKAMVDTGNIEWDVVDLEDGMFRRGLKEKLFEPLNYSVINKADLLPEAVHPYGIGIEFWAGVVAFRTDKYPSGKQPQKWADFWDVKKFPGARSLFNGPYGMLEAALLADGVPKEKLYPLDVERAFRSLDKIKQNISVWWTKGAQPAQLITDGEVDMTYAYSGRIANIMREGIPAGLTYNQASLNIEWLVVTKGTKKLKESMQFVAYCSQPKPQAIFNSMMQYGPINKKAFDYIDEKITPLLPTAPPYRGIMWIPNGEWWADHDQELSERWKQWLLK